MGIPRQRVDMLAFALALAALVAAAFGFTAARNGAALVMCAICVAGLLAGRLVGLSGGVTLAVALGLVAILWMVWVDPPASSHRTSTLAHAAGGALVGWALGTTLRRRRWPAWAVVAMIGVLSLTVAWELAELAGDQILDTALLPSWRDSAYDIFFGCLGGAAGIAGARLLAAIERPARRMV
ncbi:MAG: hypothetical protein ABI726_10725 [bacterium]